MNPSANMTRLEHLVSLPATVEVTEIDQLTGLIGHVLILSASGRIIHYERTHNPL